MYARSYLQEQLAEISHSMILSTPHFMSVMLSHCTCLEYSHSPSAYVRIKIIYIYHLHVSRGWPMNYVEAR